jgi:hypothetical protein
MTGFPLYAAHLADGWFQNLRFLITPLLPVRFLSMIV